MSERRIKKIRWKFLWISMLSFLIVMVFMGGLIYISNIRVTRKEARSVMEYIADNDGELANLPSEDEDSESREYILPGQENSGTLKDVMETLFGEQRNGLLSGNIRYFAALFDENGDMEKVRTRNIENVDMNRAEEYGRTALKSRRNFGSSGSYYYLVQNRDSGGKIVVYLDAYNEMRISNRILYMALLLMVCGLIISFFLLRWFSFRLIQPEIEAADRQKAFLTNASHELKTPLAVIRANTEVEIMMNGENEWNQSTMRQVERLTGLIQNLVMITRAEEQEDKGFIQEIDVTGAVQETVKSFLPVAENAGKKVEQELDENVRLMADESKIRQLVTLLTDNAIKYCDDGGTIRIKLSQKGKNVRLDVLNSYAEGKNTDYTKFFNRFYREETAHNIDKGGYGIGLSIAESIVKQYHGSISASWKNGEICFTCLLKPARPGA